MRAIIYKKSLKPELKEIEFPTRIPRGSSLVKVKSCGLCGSDMHKLTSKIDPSRYLSNFILGHEISGIVVKSQDKNLINKKVAVNPLIKCGVCSSCVKKNEELCLNLKSIGKELPGGFCEYVIVPNKNLVPIKSKITFDEICLVDTIAVGVHILQLIKKIKPDIKKVLIIGDGAVALCTLLVLNSYNIQGYVVGKNNFNLEKVIELGGRVIEKNNIESQSFDCVIETVGRNQSDTLNLAINSVKKNGCIIVAGVYGNNPINSVLLRELFYKQVTLRGSNSYSYWNKEDEFRIAIKLLENNKLENLNKLISHKLPLEKFEEGIALMKNKNKNTIRVVFNP